MKASLSSRAFLILSLLWLSSIPLSAFYQNSTAKVKTKYEFTDPRISEADTLLKERQYEEALEAYQKAYDTYEAESFYEGMVYAKERVGRTYRGLGKDSLSRVHYEAAAALSRDKLGPNHILESKAYLNNGIRAHFEEASLIAAQYIDSAMWVYESSGFYDSLLSKDLIDFKFYTYYYSNQSIDTLIKYLEHRSLLQETKKLNPSERLYLLNDYSMAFLQSGDFQRAMVYAVEAQRMGSEYDSIPKKYYSESLFNLARAFYYQNNFEKTIDVTNELIRYTLKNIPEHIELLSYYNLKAASLNGLKKFDLAAKEFLRVITLLEKNNKTDLFYRNAIMNLGVCYQLMADYDSAQVYLENAVALERAENEGLNVNFIDKYKYLGQYYESKLEFNKAILYYDSALRSGIGTYKGRVEDFPEDVLDKPTINILDILKRKASAFREINYSLENQSLELLQSSLEYAENTHLYLFNNREALLANQGRLFHSESFKELYEIGIDAAYNLFVLTEDQLYFKKALEFASRSKSILFLEQSGELAQMQRSKVPTSTKNEFFQTKSQIDQLESRFYGLMDDIVSSDSIRRINAELLKLYDNLQSLKDSALLEIPNAEDFELDFESLKVAINKRPARVVIEYFFGAKDLFIIAMAPNITKLKKIALDDNFDKMLNTLLTEITLRPKIGDLDKSLTRFKVASNYLYNTLLGDVLVGFDGDIKEITIIPDENLSRVPFEVLVTNNDSEAFFYELKYLIKDYNVNYALSIKQLANVPSLKQAEKGLLGMGYSSEGVANVRSSYGNLPGTEEEIKFLSRSVEGDFLLGNQANKEIFLNSAKDYDILHLAVHGEANSASRYQSSLIFNGEQDNILMTRDLYVAGLNARLAILSACESGIGEINKGEGTFSIARGFALVGVPSVVMSLWKVNDKVASVLMVKMHEGLINGKSINEALAESKRDYINASDSYTSHPYYWSAFVSLGEEVGISKKSHFSQRQVWFLTIFAGFAIFFLSLVIRKRKGTE